VNQPQNARYLRLSPLLVLFPLLAVWTGLVLVRAYPPSAFPAPWEVAAGFRELFASGRMLRDIVASLFRVVLGFSLAVLLSVPFGLWLGHRVRARAAFLPAVNFFRSLSPLAWIPFAVLWFGTGDAPAIFLIFLSAFFPVVVAVLSAVSNIPSVYFRVANDYGIRKAELFSAVILPAILPQLITALRVTAGIAWMVVVAAEMLAGKEGLGFAIWDARNGLRTDLLVCEMLVIGSLGVAIDRALASLTRFPMVRWGYER
jgi:NitT/TauT family transport system permease protein